jgi:phage gp29-like protein
VYPRHYGYWVDDPTLKLSISGMGGDWIDFPEDKFIIATFKTKTGHLLRSPLLRSLASLWIGSNFAYDWALNLAQVFGLPIRWATYDPTQPQLFAAICEMLENMGSASWGAFPAGTTLELKEAVRDVTNNPQSWLLEFADIACDILLLGQTLTTTQGARGAMALGRVHQDVRAERIETIARWWAKTLNYQLVPALMRLNFGNNDEDPYLTPDIKRQADALADAQRDEIIVSKMQVPVTKKWFYERHDIPIPDEGDELLEVPVTNVPDPADAPANARLVTAKSSSEDKLIDNVLESLTHVQARWLAGVRPFFVQLLEHARNENVTDVQLADTLQHAAKIMPELFGKLETKDLEKAFFDSMSASLVNGAALGFMQRHGPAQKKENEK